MLKGKIAVVTGGTRGIGFGIVKKFLENNATVILFGSRQETVDKALENLKAENPDWPVSGMFPSLSDAADVEKAVLEIKDKYGRIDVLVNNAGVSDNTPLDEYTAEKFDKIMNLNVNSLFYSIMPVVKIMKEQGGGSIINTSSMVSLNAQAKGVAYPTSKYAVNGMTLALARELGKDNIRVNAVAPGIIATEMLSALPEELQQRITMAIPLGRAGEADDIAEAFLYLASDMASYVSGEILSVDGAVRM